MVKILEWLENVQETVPKSITLGNGMREYATHSGTLNVRVLVGRENDFYPRQVMLKNVLFVEKLHFYLISCSVLCGSEEYTMKFNSTECIGTKEGIIQFQGSKVGGVFRVQGIPIISSDGSTNLAGASGEAAERSLAVWHARLGHAHPDRIQKLLRTEAVTGMKFGSHDVVKETRRSCVRGKHSRASLHVNKSKSNQTCAVTHSDVCGPMSVASFSGARYFFIFVEEFSGYKTVVPISKKSDVKDQFILYQAWLERKFDCAIKRLHPDNGGEFVALRGHLKEQGIEQTMTPSYSLNLDGTAERANRSVVESARAMPDYAGLSRMFWAEAVVYAAKLQNVMLSPRYVSRTCHEILTGEKPSLGYLRVFGCLAWNHIPKDNRKKLDAQSEAGIILNCFENKQYKIWVPSRRAAVISRDVKIVEEKFPAKLESWKNDSQGGEVLLQNGTEQQLIVIKPRAQAEEDPSETPSHPSNEQNLNQNEHRQPHVTVRDEFVQHLDDLEQVTYYPDTTHRDEDGTDTVSAEETDSRYPKRNRKPPSYFVPGSAHSTFYADSTDSFEVPSSAQEALKMDDSNEWQEAINSELSSLKQHGTWEVVATLEGAKPLPTRFVFVRKYDESGNIIRNKARLVVKGFMQGDVHMTSTPVVDFTSVRTAIAVALQNGFLIHQMDVQTAFLHGDIDEPIYITALEGVSLCKPGQYLRLRRGLYGLKQAPRLWHDKWLSVID